jgi:hypothetical protein
VEIYIHATYTFSQYGTLTRTSSTSQVQMLVNVKCELGKLSMESTMACFNCVTEKNNEVIHS